VIKRIAAQKERSRRVILATEDGLVAADIMAGNGRQPAPLPEWWRPLVALMSEPASRRITGISHEGMVARRRVDGVEWTPLSEACPIGQPPGRNCVRADNSGRRKMPPVHSSGSRRIPNGSLTLLGMVDV